MISTSFVPEVGPWAEDKLECLRRYLSAYTTILRKQRFKGYVYVDAFAGAGTAKIRKKFEGGIRLLRHLVAPEGGVLFEGARLLACVGFGSAAAAATKPLPQFLYERETDPEPRCNRGLRGISGFQGMNNTITEVLRVGFHTSHFALNGPDMQLQTA